MPAHSGGAGIAAACEEVTELSQLLQIRLLLRYGIGAILDTFFVMKSNCAS